MFISFVWGVFGKGVFWQGGFLSRGFLSGGLCPGGFVRGGFVLIPSRSDHPDDPNFFPKILTTRTKGCIIQKSEGVPDLRA